jgi:CRP-like cAMP-binding protein
LRSATPSLGFSEALAYPAEVVLCSQGESLPEVFHIEDGLVKLLRTHPNGSERIVGLRPAGRYVGATAVILDEPASATAVTVTACRVSRVSAPCFRQRLYGDPELSWRLHRMHSQDIDDGLARAGELSCVAARDRLLSFLRGLPAAPGARDGETHRVVLPLRHWEIAQLLGMTAPYLSHLLRRLEGDGTLCRRGALFLLQLQNSERAACGA